MHVRKEGAGACMMKKPNVAAGVLAYIGGRLACAWEGADLQ